MYCIDEEKKDELRKPLGKIFKGGEVVKATIGKRVIVVGDYSLKVFLENKIIPDIAVVDLKTRRKDIDKRDVKLFTNTYKIKIHIKNRRGCVEDSSIALAKEKEMLHNTLILVEGEEDLVAIPLLLNLRDGEVLVYGIWKEGAVVVDGNDIKKVKDRIKQVLPEIAEEI